MSWVTKTATEQLLALREHRISATELLELVIERGQEISDTINPFALELYEQARGKARLADKKLKQGRGGALCGLPITVKDSQWLAGVRCANGSPSLSDFYPSETCTAIQMLEKEDAVIFAKTTCPEFCLSGTGTSPLYGATLNPWNTLRTPGGSSAGAAAAVAAGAGSLALGSDGGGSIRIPSAFCGIVGFKPGYGIVTRRPGFTTWDSLVAYGPMCRSVADAKLMFSVIANKDAELIPLEDDKSSATKVIVSEDLGFAPVNADIRTLFRNTINTIRDAGIKIVEDNPGLPSSVVTWATIATRDMWQHKGNPKSEKYSDPGETGEYASSFIAFGNSFSEEEVKDADDYRRAVHDAYAAMFKKHRCQLLITPTLGCEAFDSQLMHPPRIENTNIRLPWLDWAGFLYDANLVGMPACTIPIGLGAEGMPVGSQIVGAPGCDLHVLKVASEIEAMTNWNHRVTPNYDDQSIAVSDEQLLNPVHSLVTTEHIAENFPA